MPYYSKLFVIYIPIHYLFYFFSIDIIPIILISGQIGKARFKYINVLLFQIYISKYLISKISQCIPFWFLINQFFTFFHRLISFRHNIIFFNLRLDFMIRNLDLCHLLYRLLFFALAIMNLNFRRHFLFQIRQLSFRRRWRQTLGGQSHRNLVFNIIKSLTIQAILVVSQFFEILKIIWFGLNSRHKRRNCILKQIQQLIRVYGNTN